VLPSVHSASLQFTVAPGVVGQTAVEPFSAGTGSAPLAQVGSEPSAQENPSLLGAGLLPSSQTAAIWLEIAGACTVTPWRERLRLATCR
jgi:hypothetical protein